MKVKIEFKGVPLEIDSWEINFPCPKCKTKNKVSFAQIKRGDTIQCIGCKSNIKLEDKDGSVKKGIESIQRGFDDLERAFK